MISTLLELAGFGCLVAAAWLWCPLVGLVAAGAVLVLVGFAVDGLNLSLRPNRKGPS